MLPEQVRDMGIFAFGSATAVLSRIAANAPQVPQGLRDVSEMTAFAAVLIVLGWLIFKYIPKLQDEHRQERREMFEKFEKLLVDGTKSQTLVSGSLSDIERAVERAERELANIKHGSRIHPLDDDKRVSGES